MDIKTKYNPGDFVYHVKGCISLKSDDLKIWMLQIRTCRCILGTKEKPCSTPIYLCDVITNDIALPYKNKAFTMDKYGDLDWSEEELLTYEELEDILYNKKHFIISSLDKLDVRNLINNSMNKEEK